MKKIKSDWNIQCNFGTDIEEPLSDIITQVFTKGGFIKSKNERI